jgi:tetrahydromethanopterin S-methyltransferase subunit F
MRDNRAKAEIAAIAGMAIGLIVLMFLVTIVIILR